MTQQVPGHTYFAPLSDYGVIRVSGDDAPGFLQGQFGNDLNLLDETNHQLNCYSNPKGRLLAVFQIFIHHGDYFLRMPREIVPATVNRLKMFVLMAKVTIEDASDTHAGIGITGPNAPDITREIAGDAPDAVNGMHSGENVAVLCVPGEGPRFEIFGERAVVESMQGALAERCSRREHNQWAYDNVLSGVPTIYDVTREEFVAQMVNLQLINGLSFKKGCYPGQEIVARMHYLGKLKRRMYLLRIDSDTPPSPGTDIFSAGSDASVGKIVDARITDDAPLRALAVLAIATAESETLHLGSAEGPTMSIDTLPYALDTQS